MALGSTQSPTEMSATNISWGDTDGRHVGMTTLPPSCADCLEIRGASTSWSPKGLTRPLYGPQGHSAAGRIKSVKNSGGPIGNRTRDSLACGTVSQPTCPPRAPVYIQESHRPHTKSNTSECSKLQVHGLLIDQSSGSCCTVQNSTLISMLHISFFAVVPSYLSSSAP